MEEIKHVTSLAPNSRKKFSFPVIAKSEMSAGKKTGIDILTVDSVEEIEKAKKFHSRANILIEITEKKDLKDYIKILMHSIDRSHLNFIGFSIKNKDFFGVLNNLLTENGQILPKIQTINCHGYFKEEKDILQFKEGLRDFNGLIVKNSIEITAEVDKMLCEKSLDLYCKVIAMKRENDTHFVVVNDSIFHSFFSFFHSELFLIPIPMYKSKETGICKVVGQACAGLDQFTPCITLPIPKIGDILLFENVGGKGNLHIENNIKMVYKR